MSLSESSLADLNVSHSHEIGLATLSSIELELLLLSIPIDDISLAVERRTPLSDVLDVSKLSLELIAIVPLRVDYICEVLIHPASALKHSINEAKFHSISSVNGHASQG